MKSLSLRIHSKGCPELFLVGDFPSSSVPLSPEKGSSLEKEVKALFSENVLCLLIFVADKVIEERCNHQHPYSIEHHENSFV
jgi:hypothetical protein